MQGIKRWSKIVSERKERREAAILEREAEISEAVRREAERHDAAVNNMHRLRALGLGHSQSAPNGPSPINEPPRPLMIHQNRHNPTSLPRPLPLVIRPRKKSFHQCEVISAGAQHPSGLSI